VKKGKQYVKISIKATNISNMHDDEEVLGV
jgi:hypothetical protein